MSGVRESVSSRKTRRSICSVKNWWLVLNTLVDLQRAADMVAYISSWDTLSLLSKLEMTETASWTNQHLRLNIAQDASYQTHHRMVLLFYRKHLPSPPVKCCYATQPESSLPSQRRVPQPYNIATMKEYNLFGTRLVTPIHSRGAQAWHITPGEIVASKRILRPIVIIAVTCWRALQREHAKDRIEARFTNHAILNNGFKVC